MRRIRLVAISGPLAHGLDSSQTGAPGDLKILITTDTNSTFNLTFIGQVFGPPDFFVLIIVTRRRRLILGLNYGDSTKGKTMAGGWAKDGAVQQQIDASLEDALWLLRARLPEGEGLERCERCHAEIPEGRRLALPGVRLCLTFQNETPFGIRCMPIRASQWERVRIRFCRAISNGVRVLLPCS